MRASIQERDRREVQPETASPEPVAKPGYLPEISASPEPAAKPGCPPEISTSPEPAAKPGYLPEIPASLEPAAAIRHAGSSFYTEQTIDAQVFDSGFSLAHDTYNGLSAASDGNIYYVLCSEQIDQGGRMYCFETKTNRIRLIGDLTHLCGEQNLGAIAQGKSHVPFFEAGGKLYFATHLGYYQISNGLELPGQATSGYRDYPGGHLLVYDMKTGSVRSLGIPRSGEGVLTLAMDPVRKMLYGLTWPGGYLFRYDAELGKMSDLGPFTGKGESGKGKDYRVICRSIAIDPRDGRAYMTRADGQIAFVRPDGDSVEIVRDEDMRKDYFGQYSIHTAGSMAYNWRQVFWYPEEEVFYGVHGNSGYLFRFDPQLPRLEVLERLTTIRSKRSGMFDQFSFGYLGFALGPDWQTIYYLTGGPVYKDGKRIESIRKIARGAARGLENLHLITYNIPSRRYCDHGPIFYPDGERPLYVNSIAPGVDGWIYTLARIERNGRTLTDLVRIADPFHPLAKL